MLHENSSRFTWVNFPRNIVALQDDVENCSV
jgi:hypothetical protein